MHPPTPELSLSTAATDAGSDIELALQASCGNAIAFETIVRRHNRLLFRTARGVVADDAEAQDVVQETYLRAFGNLRSFRGESSLGTWLARIAINLALAAMRKQGRLVAMEEDANPEDAMSDETPGDAAPHAMAERGEMRVLLQASIEALPVMYRSVFMLRAVQEMTVDETAYCLGVSQDVVKTRYLRARAMLRDALSTRIEAGARDTFAFAGERCDAVLAHVMGELLRRRLIRLH